MRGLPVTQAVGFREAGARIAWTGIGLSAMLAVFLPLALLAHPARSVGTPRPDGLAPDAAAGLPGAVASGTVSGASAPALTQDEPSDGQGDGNGRGKGDPRAQQLSRAQVVALVQRRYHARVVRTHLLQDANGRALYEFRLLSSAGKVWTVRIDAYSGAELP